VLLQGPQLRTACLATTQRAPLLARISTVSLHDSGAGSVHDVIPPDVYILLLFFVRKNGLAMPFTQPANSLGVALAAELLTDDEFRTA